MKRHRVCDQCKGERSYSERFDAYYCAACNEWLERRCSDVNCTYCDRPTLPSKAKGGL